MQIPSENRLMAYVGMQIYFEKMMAAKVGYS